jgi:hypothetical protein
LLLLCLAVLLLCSAAWCNTATATDLDWSDDFETGHDGWAVIQGDFDVVDGRLVGTTNGPADSHCSIYHESNVSMGTWSFDVYIPQDLSAHWIPVAFMAESATHLADVYYTVEFYDTEMMLSRYNGLSQSTVGTYDFPSNSHCGLHHISVVRNETNYFYLYHNGSLVIEGLSLVPLLEWSYFVFYSFLSPSAAWIDNVNVTEYVEDETTTTPTDSTSETTDTSSSSDTGGGGETGGGNMTMTYLLVGGGAAVVIIAIVVVMRMRS